MKFKRMGRGYPLWKIKARERSMLRDGKWNAEMTVVDDVVNDKPMALRGIVWKSSLYINWL